LNTLRATGLSKSFGSVRAVDGVSLAVAPGELVALIGPNGAGKTTCFNLIGGQLRPDAGTVELGGESLIGLPPHQIWRLGVGRTFQIAAAFPSMSVHENVQMALMSWHRRLGNPLIGARALYADQALDLLARVGMAEQAERACSVLSYGDLKRLELAIAMASDPKLLLMDEPTSGMSSRERAALMDLTRKLAKSQAIAVLFTEHDMDVVFGHADRILVLSRGRIIAQGNPDEVRANPEVRAVYLGDLDD
jgi:branched-chain amino acid transport system ATP-binding protein